MIREYIKELHSGNELVHTPAGEPTQKCQISLIYIDPYTQEIKFKVKKLTWYRLCLYSQHLFVAAMNVTVNGPARHKPRAYTRVTWTAPAETEAEAIHTSTAPYSLCTSYNTIYIKRLLGNTLLLISC